jgi:lipopolysaccharide/colanic/teichoic acid biosynthesis glycosyltransferase
MQRLFDILLSGIALVLLSPFFLPLMFILRVTGEGEVFFTQQRVGQGGKHFRLYKFATMLKNSPYTATGTVTVHNDPRILPIGRVLRKTKINEMPQLINIFKGDMSVIGPRPQTQRCFDVFPLLAQRDIITVRPGLSGVGSIIFRNEEEMLQVANDPDRFYDNLIMSYKGKLEQWYVVNRNSGLYFLLIFLTVWVVLFSNASFIWKLLDNLPKPPEELKNWM